jgi:hypothetical protein
MCCASTTPSLRPPLSELQGGGVWVCGRARRGSGRRAAVCCARAGVAGVKLLSCAGVCRCQGCVFSEQLEVHTWEGLWRHGHSGWALVYIGQWAAGGTPAAGAADGRTCAPAGQWQQQGASGGATRRGVCWAVVCGVAHQLGGAFAGCCGPSGWVPKEGLCLV